MLKCYFCQHASEYLVVTSERSIICKNKGANHYLHVLSEDHFCSEGSTGIPRPTVPVAKESWYENRNPERCLQ